MMRGEILRMSVLWLLFFVLFVAKSQNVPVVMGQYMGWDNLPP